MKLATTYTANGNAAPPPMDRQPVDLAETNRTILDTQHAIKPILALWSLLSPPLRAFPIHIVTPLPIDTANNHPNTTTTKIYHYSTAASPPMDPVTPLDAAP